ncbi:DUF5018 domain-containing protein [uncultured Kordia sp.]|uniref:DUF5018 domain-containing protein n=1 Tax=uncultured Kordia sp. TaxID=507699 RepID=UPI00261CECEC|nr:DUF5018 domain-containing protein [uncultured Kordia sp.]
MKGKSLLLLLLFSLTFMSCSDDDGPQLSSENKIISFKISQNGQDFDGIINQSTKTINVTTSDIDLSNSIVPTIEISNNASISPSASTAQNFSQNVQYTVTAENGDKAIYTVTVNSSDNKITAFSITPHETTFSGVIDESNHTITIETVGLEQNSTLVPQIEFSQNATISPNASDAQDFSQDIEYTVTAQNGAQTTYAVITNNTLFSDEKKILSFQFDIDNEIFEGVINHDNLTIFLITDKDVSSVAPIIEISENATISPNSDEAQDFNSPVYYTVTAQDGTSNIYTVNVSKREINSTIRKCYVRATSFGRVTYLDLSQNYQLYLENDTNSYLLNYFDTETWVNNGVPTTNFYFYFDENIETALDYKLRFKINGLTEAETPYEIDVLKENAPEITSANQLSYSYNDTLILSGNNLLPGLRIPANANVYQYNSSYVSVNSNQTSLTFPMTINPGMFPSWVGQSSPRPTRVNIYHNGRYGDSIVVDFN